MAINIVGMPNLVLSTETTVLSGTIEGFDDAYAVSIQAPGTLNSTVVTVQVSVTTSAAAATYSNLQSGGTDVTLSASKALVISPCPFRMLQLSGSSTEAAARTFSVAKIVLI